MNIEERLEEVECCWPYIATFGVPRDELTDFKIVIEKENILPMPSLFIAILCCFSAYFLFNINYPPEFVPTMLFIEQYICKVKPSQRLLVSVSALIDCLKKA